MMKLFYTIILFFILSSTINAQVVYVNATATGANDGTSWTNAYTELSSALQNQTNNMEIWIASGIYKPTNGTDRFISFDITATGIEIYGGFNGTETSTDQRLNSNSPTILSGDLLSNDTSSSSYNNSSRFDNSLRVVNITNSGNDCLFDGITIRGGYANAIGGRTNGAGLGINAGISDLTVVNCVFDFNASRNNGGAILLDYAVVANANYTFERCQFTRNFSRIGGAIYARKSGSGDYNLTITNSLFRDNVTSDIGTNVFGQTGSSIYATCNASGQMNVTNIHNTYVENRDFASFAMAGRSTVVATQQAGQFFYDEAFSIYWNNYNNGGSPSLASGVTAGNSAPAGFIIQRSLEFNGFNNLSGASLNGNISSDPLFLNPNNDNFRLNSGSPAIDYGVLFGLNGSLDLDGNLRVFNSNPDLGAYEFGSSPPCFVNIPDAAFKATLLNNSAINTNGNNEIECSEASGFTGFILLDNPATVDLTGIEFFTNITALGTSAFLTGLTSIDLSSNSFLSTINLRGLTSLNFIDITQCAALTELRLQGSFSGVNNNTLNAINLQGNSSLIEVDVQGFNLLNTIDLSANPVITELDLRSNNISTLDLSAQSQLIELNLAFNNLALIDLSNNVVIEEIILNDNPLAVLNTSTLVQLEELYVRYCQLTSLDFSANPNLRVLDLRENNLTMLNLANGNNTSLGFMRVENNLNLNCIQIDSNFTPPSAWVKDATANYSSNCTAGISDTSELTISIYPNPTSGVIYINSFNDMRIDKLMIYDSSGKLVASDINKEFINISSFTSGIYYLQIHIADSVVTRQIIKD